jgi:hypothetical protein
MLAVMQQHDAPANEGEIGLFLDRPGFPEWHFGITETV